MLTLFRYKPQGLTIQEEEHRPESEKKLTESGQASIYSDISDSTLGQIKNIDLDGSFGSKIDTVARHILWIRQHDPGSKSVVFSQYKDFLDVLARAFGQFRIGFTGIDRKGGTERFKNDPGVSNSIPVISDHGRLSRLHILKFLRSNAFSFMLKHTLPDSTWSTPPTYSCVSRL